MPETTKQAGAAVEHFPLMVPGARPAAERREVRSPYDGQLLATLEQADGAGAQHALETAAGLFADRDGWLPPPRRIEILEGAAAIMTERREALADPMVKRTIELFDGKLDGVEKASSGGPGVSSDESSTAG